MPLMKIDIMRGRSKEEIKELLDISYEVMLETLGVPENDRYQIVTQHDENEMIILDTGLGFSRTHEVVVFSLVSRPRTVAQKERFYKKLAMRLNEKMGVNPSDVMVNFSINQDEDWSFGQGEAQFLTGKLY